jgi:tRNA pseudouridine32 synthase/23S rRNA pseudouridine746 synthase
MCTIVYRDECLLVLDKPSGLLAVPGRGADLQDCLSARAQREFPGALVVHRLDRDTSGLMVMALDVDSHRELSRQFAVRAVEKHYVAVVFGILGTSSGTIDLPLRKDFDRPPRHMVDRVNGRPARTDWRVIESSADRSRLRSSRSRADRIKFGCTWQRWGTRFLATICTPPTKSARCLLGCCCTPNACRWSTLVVTVA